MLKPFNKFKTREYLILISGIISLLLLIFYSLYKDDIYGTPEALGFSKANELMERAISEVSNYCADNNLHIEIENDPYRTGLIGTEYSDITTTIGHLDAKRTTLNPAFAALIAQLLSDAGVVTGDTIAIACSGSFPALMIASLSAAASMGINSRVIISLGSSSFGANNIDLTILDIYNIITSSIDFNSDLIAVSLGGEKDIGLEFEAGIKNTLTQSIARSGYQLLYEEDLNNNITRRISLYNDYGKIGLEAFVSCGGSLSSMGSSALSLHLDPGLILSASLPEENSRGTIFTMLANRIPVIHLLYIKGLCQRYNIPWDPVTVNR